MEWDYTYTATEFLNENTTAWKNLRSKTGVYAHFMANECLYLGVCCDCNGNGLAGKIYEEVSGQGNDQQSSKVFNQVFKENARNMIARVKLCDNQEELKEIEHQLMEQLNPKYGA